MNNSDSPIHLTKLCQAQAETQGLWTELPQLKGNTSSLLNGSQLCLLRRWEREEMTNSHLEHVKSFF